MKQSFTYSGEAKTNRDAKRKAKKEGRTFSDVVEGLLKMYLEAPVWKSIHDDKPLPTFSPETHS